MKKTRIVVFIIAVISTIAPFALPQIQTAKVDNGQLEGVVVDGIASYKGIPFATPPMGDLRWKSPVAAKAWTGIRKADAYAAGCMQDPGMVKMMGAAANVSEDCLYLTYWRAPIPMKAAFSCAGRSQLPPLKNRSDRAMENGQTLY
jgi:para-nitrobenzyl esterase